MLDCTIGVNDEAVISTINLNCSYLILVIISLNLETAERIGFQPDFNLLLACETIYPKRTTEGDDNE